MNEKLIHPKKLVFAVRNAGKDCRNAMQWSKKKDGKNSPRDFNLSEPEIFIPNDMVGAPDADPAVKPFTDNQQRNVRAYPPDWADTFGSNYYSHAQAEELAGFTGRKDPDTSHASVTYNDTDIQVTSKMTSKRISNRSCQI